MLYMLIASQTVMVEVTTSGVVDSGFDLLSVQTKDNKIGSCFILYYIINHINDVMVRIVACMQ